ncbi:MAG: DUF1330 domain-containing protein [Pararhizobium sp.]
MAKGYWIAHIDVADPERYKDYIRTATPAYEKYGAVFLVRGGQFEAVEGAARKRTVVIEFPSYQAAIDCYESETYRAARAIRQATATGEVMIVEGHEA